jgi:protein TonB
MAVLLLLLVMSLHVWLGFWLLKPHDPVIEPAPLKVMEVALLAVPQPVVVPPPPAPAPPKPIQPKKPLVKKVVKKNTPMLKKPTEIPKPEPLVEEKPAVVSAPAPVETKISESKPVAPVVKPQNTNTIVTGVVPLVRIQPKYPSRAINRRIEGWVKIEFTISSTGSVSDATVVAAEPSDIFDFEALKAIKNWQFKEKIVNGVAVEQRAVQTLQFKLTQ